MADGKAVTTTMLEHTSAGSKGVKTRSKASDLTGCNRDHARKARRQAETPEASAPPETRAAVRLEVLEPLRAVEVLERAGELRMSNEIRAKLLRCGRPPSSGST